MATCPLTRTEYRWPETTRQEASPVASVVRGKGSADAPPSAGRSVTGNPGSGLFEMCPTTSTASVASAFTGVGEGLVGESPQANSPRQASVQATFNRVIFMNDMIRKQPWSALRILFGTFLCLSACAAVAQERAVPDTPVPVTITSYQIVGFALEREPDWRLTVTFKDSNGKIYTDEHYGPSTLPNPAGGDPIVVPTGAEALVKQLNTANLSTVSLMKRLLQHLVQHGKIPASTITGTPEVAP